MLKLFFAVAVFVTVPVLAQVRVVESSPRISGGAQTPSTNVSSDVYSQIRALQEEISSLRGLIEEQAHEISKLKQLQLDNYMELDRRLSTSVAPATTTIVPPADISVLSSVESQSIDPTVDVEDIRSEKEVYTAAYDLLNQRDYDAATQEFQHYLNRFPQGQYASNSCYWLGKIANQNGNLEQAKSWFAKLISDYPDAQKVSDAKYDLGRVYFNLGEKIKAKAIMQDVSGGSSDAARLAKKFLRDNF